jgi:hypothetical protein
MLWTRLPRCSFAIAACAALLIGCANEEKELLGNFSTGSDLPGNPAPSFTGAFLVGTTSYAVQSASVSANGNGALLKFDGTGSFNYLLLSLPRRTGTVTLTPNSANSNGLVNVNSTTSDLTGTVTIEEATITPSTESTGYVSYRVNLAGATAVLNGVSRALSGTVSATFDNRGTGGTGGSGGSGGTLNLVCPGSLPSGYQCVSNAGVQAPARYNIPALQGTWVESSAEVCMTLGSNGSSAFKYKPGSFGSGGSTSGLWGALVNKSGQFQPTSGPYYVFTGATDAQIKLLTFDPTTGRFLGWGFVKGSCPW